MDAGPYQSDPTLMLLRYQTLLNVGRSIVSHQNVRELIGVVSDYLQQVVDCDGVWLTLLEAESGQLRVFALDPIFKENATATEGQLVPMEGTPSEQAIKTQQSIIFSRSMLEKSPSPVAQSVAAGGLESGCIAPLISQGRAIGTIAIASRRENAFTREDAELVTQIAGQVAVAIENALNLERARKAEQESRRQFERERLMLQISNAIVSQLDLQDLLRVVSSSICAAMGTDSVGVGLFDQTSGELRVFAADYPPGHPLREIGIPLPLEGSPSGLAFTTGQPVFLDRPDFDRFPAELVRQIYDSGYRSGGSIPLITQGRRLGVLGVASKQENRFSDDDKELLIRVANQVAIAVDNALAYREIETLKNKLSEEKLYLEEEINTAYNFEEVIGSSPALRRILKQVETVAPTDSTVLIQGETGTGKELIARAIHFLSGRKDRTLVKLNCAAIPSGLLESELFGHEKGAFTGAIAQRIGRFELANKGTLFLDEVGEIPLELQPKLLRVLQEQEFERLGNARTQRVDVRLIAATNRDLAQMSAENRYRSDLYYRLNVFPITIPPLRERPEDIPMLVRFFANKFAGRMKKQIETIPKEAIATLQRYHWPGNIRELENMIERAVILTQGAELQIPMVEIPGPPKAATIPVQPLSTSRALSSPDTATLEAIEREHILRTLRETNWVVGGPAGAAARLGMKRTTLQNRIRKLGITRQG